MPGRPSNLDTSRTGAFWDYITALAQGEEGVVLIFYLSDAG